MEIKLCSDAVNNMNSSKPLTLNKANTFHLFIRAVDSVSAKYHKVNISWKHSVVCSYVCIEYVCLSDFIILDCLKSTSVFVCLCFRDLWALELSRATNGMSQNESIDIDTFVERNYLQIQLVYNIFKDVFLFAEFDGTM